MTRQPGPEQERLSVLVGSWRTEGWTKDTAEAPAARIEAADTYEWLPGRFALLHTVDARVGEERVEGAEIIGWDPCRGAYVTQYFGNGGPNAYEASFAEEHGTLVWGMRSRRDRFTGNLSDDGNRIDGHWEQRDDDGRWQPWMAITLTRDAR
jgi:uncharacterized protein DUF1579